ncbi:MAG: glycosyltransferase family 39 protein [Proteobacteria bacterium]|nr:glycosyltransferase family 39 protein [Pseudomonadota bacterium]
MNECEPSLATERFHRAILVALCIVVLFTDSASKELHGTAVFYASLAREILESADLMQIYSDDRAYLLKPPLVVWLSALGCKLFGLSNFGVTFVSRIAGVGVILLTYALLRRWWNHPIAWLGAFAILTNSTFVQFTATLRMDSALMFGLLLSVVGWAYRDRAWGGAAMYGGITIAVLSKGPLGFAAIPLIVGHAILIRESPITRSNGWWSLLLLPIVIWYGVLTNIHGLDPITELGADTFRATAMPGLDRWQSAYQEYALKSWRRYWPWLPFIVLGAMLAMRRVWIAELPRNMRLTYVWVLLWLVVVVIAAIGKPDHDIRYFYPALPVLGLFAGVGLMALTKNRFPNWIPAVLLVVFLSAVGWPGDPSWRAMDTRETIARLNRSIAFVEQPLAIGGYPVPIGQARRQNTHRDWVHFYTGKIPTVLSWEQVERDHPRFTKGVFLTHSRGHEARLEQFGLAIAFTTSEMIYAVPR